MSDETEAAAKLAQYAPDTQLLRIARVAHAARAETDADTTLPTWDKAPASLRLAIIEAVLHRLRNPAEPMFDRLLCAITDALADPKSGDFVTIEGVKMSAATLRDLFRNPPKGLHEVERVDDTIVVTSILNLGAAAAYFAGQVSGDYKTRARAEHAELSDRLTKLEAFIDEGRGEMFRNLPVDERSRMITQRNAMREYANVLAERIAAFDK